jgi:AcrR family transcriptional regulator
MRRRAAAREATRERIMAAALDAYRDHGVGGTTMLEVARRADVSPGTVGNHFATPDDLARAVVGRLVDEQGVPDAAILAGAGSAAERIDLFVAALFDVYARGAAWYELFRGELGRIPALIEGEARFWSLVQPLYAAAFGPLLDEPRARGAILGLTSPGTLSALTGAGCTVPDAARLVALALRAWAAAVAVDGGAASDHAGD